MSPWQPLLVLFISCYCWVSVFSLLTQCIFVLLFYYLIYTTCRESIVILKSWCWVFRGNIHFKVPWEPKSGSKKCLPVSSILLSFCVPRNSAKSSGSIKKNSQKKQMQEWKKTTHILANDLNISKSCSVHIIWKTGKWAPYRGTTPKLRFKVHTDTSQWAF